MTTAARKQPAQDRIKHEEERLTRYAANLINWVPNSLYLYTYSQCIYCGDDGPTIDHVFPICFLTSQDRTGGMHSRGVTVDSCRECNSAILGGKIFFTFQERLAYARAGIARRYRKALNMPAWTHAELCSVKGSIRRLVRRNQILRKEALRRIEWQDTAQFRDNMNLIREQVAAEHPENHTLQAYFAPQSH